MAAPFDVLAEPTRRRILDLLLDGPRLVGELTEALGSSQPGTSKHLRVLREAGLVRVRPEAQRRWYELHPEPLREVDAWLAPYRRMWRDSFAALERHLDAMPDDPGDRDPGDRDPGDRDPDDPDHPDPGDRDPDDPDPGDRDPGEPGEPGDSESRGELDERGRRGATGPRPATQNRK